MWKYEVIPIKLKGGGNKCRERCIPSWYSLCLMVGLIWQCGCFSSNIRVLRCALCTLWDSLQACRVNIHVCVCAACFYVFCLTRGGFGPSHRAVLNSSALQTETHGSHRLHKRQTTVYDFNISRQKTYLPLFTAFNSAHVKGWRDVEVNVFIL